MKQLITLIIFSVLSTAASAHPGGNKLVCKSAKNSGSKQKVELSLSRANGVGWVNPTIEVTVDGKKFQLTTPDEMNNYGTTFHNSPLQTIMVTAEVPYEDNVNAGYFSVVGMPATVKAFDMDGKPVKWSLEAEKDDCNDSNGSATFQGIIHGNFNVEKTDVNVDAQIMDCVLTYNSGMAC
ncbi:MAG: hypothetical protein H7177_02575 [Rhizobacter sp.]|nr:hypothetical protein [Bacteriovorax sp.]